MSPTRFHLRCAAVLLWAVAAACGPGIAGSPWNGEPIACEGNRLLRVTNRTSRNVEVQIKEGHANTLRTIGTVMGEGERTFQVPSAGVLDVHLVPYERTLTRYELICG